MSNKQDYSLVLITKNEASPLLDKYHYLTGISRGFKSGFNVGLRHNSQIVGVCIFTGVPVPQIMVGAFGIDKKDQAGFWELSRLVLEPNHQSQEHNLASWFVSRCLKLLKQSTKVRAVLSYADNKFHTGVVYAACNFKYFGLTALKKDFWIKQTNGTFRKHSRGPVKNLAGEWRDRTQKHRFLMLFDKKLNCLWEEIKWINPSKTDLVEAYAS